MTVYGLDRFAQMCVVLHGDEQASVPHIPGRIHVANNTPRPTALRELERAYEHGRLWRELAAHTSNFAAPAAILAVQTAHSER